VSAPFRLEPLGPSHERSGFSCGVEALDQYFALRASQDVRRRVSACYVAVEDGSGRVAGFYTLAASSVPLSDLAPDSRKRLPRYPAVPVARIGRLAIAKAFQGKGLGGALLADAALRATRSELGVFALIVDAKDEEAAAFYRHHGFEPLGGNDRQLLVSLERFTRTVASKR
jgi:ribosomal protein S18 acetylase RimI-like enzyme